MEGDRARTNCKDWSNWSVGSRRHRHQHEQLGVELLTWRNAEPSPAASRRDSDVPI